MIIEFFLKIKYVLIYSIVKTKYIFGPEHFICICIFILNEL